MEIYDGMKLLPCEHIYTCTDGYNQYVKLIGGAIGAGACAALRQENKIDTITDDTPLLHFLSGKTYLTVVMAHLRIKSFDDPQIQQMKERVMTVCTLWQQAS